MSDLLSILRGNIKYPFGLHNTKRKKPVIYNEKKSSNSLIFGSNLPQVLWFVSIIAAIESPCLATVFLNSSKLTKPFSEGNSTTLSSKGRHDPCVLPRAVPMVEAMVALVLADHLLRNHGQCKLF